MRDEKYIRDRKFSDRHVDAIRRCLGPFVIDIASFEVDTKQAGDLIVLKKPAFTIACRIRRAEYLAKFPGEFTIRSRRSSGVETELSKLLKGWGKWFFYGTSSES